MVGPPWIFQHILMHFAVLQRQLAAITHAVTRIRPSSSQKHGDLATYDKVIVNKGIQNTRDVCPLVCKPETLLERSSTEDGLTNCIGVKFPDAELLLCFLWCPLARFLACMRVSVCWKFLCLPVTLQLRVSVLANECSSIKGGLTGTCLQHDMRTGNVKQANNKLCSSHMVPLRDEE